MNLSFKVCFIVLGFISCAETVTQSTEKLTVNTPVIIELDTLNSIPIVGTDTIQIKDTLQETDLSKNKGLASYLKFVKSEMKSVPNPVRAVYEGTDFGDYFHLSFRTKNGVYLDFADGANNFGEYQLFDAVTYEDNAKYIGKTFEIYWEFKKSIFLCCDGEMDGVVAKVPSIIKLKLLTQ